MNMNIGTPLRCMTLTDRGNVWTVKDCQGSYDHFGVKGTSLSKNSFLPKLSQESRFEKNARPVINSHLKTSLTPKKNGAIRKLEKPPSVENKLKHLENSDLQRNEMPIKARFCDNNGISSRSAKQKAYLRMVLSRSSHEKSQSKDKNFDEDYLSLDDEQLSRYLTEESEIEHSSFIPRQLRSYVTSSKCRLRMKRGDLCDAVPDKRFVKYGK